MADGLTKAGTCGGCDAYYGRLVRWYPLNSKFGIWLCWSCRMWRGGGGSTR